MTNENGETLFVTSVRLYPSTTSALDVLARRLRRNRSDTHRMLLEWAITNADRMVEEYWESAR